MKVDLFIPDEPRNKEYRDGLRYWRQSRPFVLNPRGILIHRVRSGGCAYYWSHFNHYFVRQWCGNGCTGKLLELLNEPPANRLVCAHCEAKAVAAGQPSSSELAGRHVCIGTMKAHRLCCNKTEN